MQTPKNYVKNLRREKSRNKVREIQLNQRDYKEFSILYHKFNSLGIPSPLTRGEDLFLLNYWPGGGWNANEIGVTATIFIFGVVVTAAIVEA